MRARELDPRIQKIAATLQYVRPDIVMLCEFDQQADRDDYEALTHFLQRYCHKGHFDLEGISYPHVYLPSSNTGLTLATGLRELTSPILPEDGLGFGCFPGQYNFVFLSKFPIINSEIQSMQLLKWRSMPNNAMPQDYYHTAIESQLRLSSKNHVKLVVDINGAPLEFLLCHPTPPVFDGSERRNYHRNHDEIRLAIDLIDGADYLRDDAGNTISLGRNGPFVLLGDFNNDAFDGDGDSRIIRELLYHPRVHRQCAVGHRAPRSRGGFYHGMNLQRRGEHRIGKAAFWTHLKGLRLDYVLPSSEMTVLDSGVFWPDKKQRFRSWFEDRRGRQTPTAYSDHRLVWVDVEV